MKRLHQVTWKTILLLCPCAVGVLAHFVINEAVRTSFLRTQEALAFSLQMNDESREQVGSEYTFYEYIYIYIYIYIIKFLQSYCISYLIIRNQRRPVAAFAFPPNWSTWKYVDFYSLCIIIFIFSLHRLSSRFATICYIILVGTFVMPSGVKYHLSYLYTLGTTAQIIYEQTRILKMCTINQHLAVC